MATLQLKAMTRKILIVYGRKATASAMQINLYLILTYFNNILADMSDCFSNIGIQLINY